MEKRITNMMILNLQRNSIPSISKTLAFEDKILCLGENPEMPKIVAESTHSSQEKIWIE